MITIDEAPPRTALERTFVRVRWQEPLEAWITLERAPLNVLNVRMLEELAEALVDLTAHRLMKLVVLTGTGRAFSAGAEVADHLPERVGTMLERFHRAVNLLQALPCPTVAVVNGPALGGGAELVLACDLAVLRDDATLGFPEVRLGVFPPVAAALLPRRVGLQRAMELVLTGRSLSATEAVGMGLASAAFPADGFDEAVAGFLALLRGSSGPVLRLAKRAVREGAGLPPPEALDRAETLYLEELMGLRDPGEGLAAFLEKRPPIWEEA